MRKRLILTRADGCVSVVQPTQWAMRVMCSGGRRLDVCRGRLDALIEQNIAAGHGADASARYVRAMQFGGCNSQEALAIIRDRDCAHRGTGIELWDVDDVPTDRWFRAAWRRSHNGGPIGLEMTKARQIQFERLCGALESENAKRQRNLYREPLQLNLDPYKHQIKKAADASDLRRIWPEALT